MHNVPSKSSRKSALTFCFLSMLLSADVVAVDTYRFSCGTPSDPSGRAIAAPTGNLGFAAVPGAMCGGNAEFTWDYVGTLEDGTNKYSFMANIVQLERLIEECVEGTCGSFSMGFHGIDFAFRDPGNTYFLSGLYGGDLPLQIKNALVNSIDWVFSSSDLEGFELDARLMTSTADEARWRVVSSGEQPTTPVYLGYPGQPGHRFSMNGAGKAFLWRIQSDGAKHSKQYRYVVTIDFIDERGVVAQGYGGGYVGPALAENGDAIPEAAIAAKTRISEYEIAQPRLKVLDWSVSIFALGNAEPGFAAS
jgi:hypothetical protein